MVPGDVARPQGNDDVARFRESAFVRIDENAGPPDQPGVQFLRVGGEDAYGVHVRAGTNLAAVEEGRLAGRADRQHVRFGRAFGGSFRHAAGYPPGCNVIGECVSPLGRPVVYDDPFDGADRQDRVHVEPALDARPDDAQYPGILARQVLRGHRGRRRRTYAGEESGVHQGDEPAGLRVAQHVESRDHRKAPGRIVVEGGNDLGAQRMRSGKVGRHEKRDGGPVRYVDGQADGDVVFLARGPKPLFHGFDDIRHGEDGSHIRPRQKTYLAHARLQSEDVFRAIDRPRN